MDPVQVLDTPLGRFELRERTWILVSRLESGGILCELWSTAELLHTLPHDLHEEIMDAMRRQARAYLDLAARATIGDPVLEWQAAADHLLSQVAVHTTGHDTTGNAG